MMNTFIISIISYVAFVILISIAFYKSGMEMEYIILFLAAVTIGFSFFAFTLLCITALVVI